MYQFGRHYGNGNQQAESTCSTAIFIYLLDYVLPLPFLKELTVKQIKQINSSMLCWPGATWNICSLTPCGILLVTVGQCHLLCWHRMEETCDGLCGSGGGIGFGVGFCHHPCPSPRPILPLTCPPFTPFQPPCFPPALRNLLAAWQGHLPFSTSVLHLAGTETQN